MFIAYRINMLSIKLRICLDIFGATLLQPSFWVTTSLNCGTRHTVWSTFAQGVIKIVVTGVNVVLFSSCRRVGVYWMPFFMGGNRVDFAAFIIAILVRFVGKTLLTPLWAVVFSCLAFLSLDHPTTALSVVSEFVQDANCSVYR